MSLIIAAGCSWWLTQFVNASPLMEVVRERYRAWIAKTTGMTRPESKLAILLVCPWCIGAWISLVMYATWWLAAGCPGTVAGVGAWWFVPAAGLAANTAWAGSLTVLGQVRDRADFALAQLKIMADVDAETAARQRSREEHADS